MTGTAHERWRGDGAVQYLGLLGIQVEHLLDVRETLDVALGSGGDLSILQQAVALQIKCMNVSTPQPLELSGLDAPTSSLFLVAKRMRSSYFIALLS